jgi:hypothetical protein
MIKKKLLDSFFCNNNNNNNNLFDFIHTLKKFLLQFRLTQINKFFFLSFN